MKPLLILSVCLIVASGCNSEREQAKDKVLDALNPTRVRIASNQFAVLKLTSGYAALDFSTRGVTSTFAVYLSKSGKFDANQTPIANYSFHQRDVAIDGVKVNVSYGGEDKSEVMLDFGDSKTGLAVVDGKSLDQIDIDALGFETTPSLSTNDLMKSIGY